LNFVFVSPQFPKTYWNFCDRLKHNGVNVLGIGDSGYDEIPDELKECLTEYYRVDSMADYDAMVRAMGYFTFKYGKIDWLESNNEFWLEQDAALRTDFNITTGAQNDFIDRIKYKSKMKESYIAAGVPVARHHMVHENGLDDARAVLPDGLRLENALDGTDAEPLRLSPVSVKFYRTCPQQRRNKEDMP